MSRMTRTGISDVFRAQRAACPLHKNDPDDGLGYLAAHENAERRMAAGETQRQCERCDFWIWSRLFVARPLSTETT